MATTRIMPLHAGKGRTVRKAISDIIDYVKNPEKTDHGRLITSYQCDSRVADAQFLLDKQTYAARTGRMRGADDVIAYHLRQSFVPGEITPEEANRLGVELARRFTKGKHAFVVCTHIDKSHTHNHITILLSHFLIWLRYIKTWREGSVMLRQIRYFQSVVRNNSFSEAAEECNISQSAISQQIKALENELGFPLLERHNRKFVLTPAGEHFYKKSLVLIADYEQMCSETAKIARGDEAVLKIGYLRSHNSPEVHQALAEFSARYPRVDLQLLYGNHEDLFYLLRTGGADLVLNDQRRAFSDEYVNLILATNKMYIELAARNPVTELPSVTVQELKNIPCILVSSKEQQAIEREFYQTVIGIQSEILYAENLEEARMMVVSGQGFLPVEGGGPAMTFGASIRRVPLFRGEEQITRNYCLFWKKDNSGYYVEEFANILKKKFE